MSASTVLLEAEVLRLTRINEQAETRIEQLECRVEQLISQADGLASSQNPNQSIRYLEKLRDEREIAEKDAEEAGRAVQNMKAALQFVVCARRETRDKVVQYAREARKTGRVFTEAPGLPTGVSAPIWGRIVETVARLNLDAVE
jgi:cell division septum initiation protein DivIVA